MCWGGKMKSYLILILISLLALTGCKPKQTTLSGQVFIVTQGAENVKLGDVEILLIEKSQATDFLQKKQPAIESEMALKQQELTNAEQEVATASQNADKAQAYFDWFTVNKPYKTNADYAKIKSQWNILFNQYVYQTNYVERLLAYTTNNLSDENAENNFMAAVNRREEMAGKLNSLNDELETIKSDMVATETEKLEVVKSSVSKASADVAIANTNLENSPSLADYFEDFSPVIVQKTISDSDGKFSFVYPRDKSFAIFASAQRMVLNKTEKYFWLVNAPTNAESVQIFLSNNNLVEVDPDGYFTLKPKAASQESSTQ
jgi:hypothetical protein